MLIKITRFRDLYQNGELDSPESRSHLLLHAGKDYYNVSRFLQDSYKKDILLHAPCVDLFIMHQCLELLAKALATSIDPATLPKEHSHKTSVILIRYSAHVHSFQEILSDSTKMSFIEELEKGYLGARYGEVHVYFDFELYPIFNQIAERLMDEYHNLTGVPFLPEHFPTKK